MTTTAATPTQQGPRPQHHPGTDMPFFACFIALTASYVLLILAMLGADFLFISEKDPVGLFTRVLGSPEIRFSIILSLISCTITAVLSVVVAIPIGYLFSHFNFPGKRLVDALLDMPIVLPPLVVGLSLLILFSNEHVVKYVEVPFMWVIEVLHINDLLALIGARDIRGITYDLPAVILAQFAVACAFAVRTMRVTFDQIEPRREQVALTLGCRRSQAFFRVVLPEARAGALTAGTLAWARAMGEFGPILVFAGATRMKTEVLPTTVFLELSIGDVEAAVAVSMIMVFAAMVVLGVTRMFGVRQAVI